MRLHSYILFVIAVLIGVVIILLLAKQQEKTLRDNEEKLLRAQEARSKQRKMVSLQSAISKDFSGEETEYTDQIIKLLQTAGLDTSLLELSYPESQEQWVFLDINQQHLFSLKYKGNLKYWLTNKSLEEFEASHPSTLDTLPATKAESPHHHCRVFLSTPQDLKQFEAYFIEQYNNLASA